MLESKRMESTYLQKNTLIDLSDYSVHFKPKYFLINTYDCNVGDVQCLYIHQLHFKNLNFGLQQKFMNVKIHCQRPLSYLY